MPRRRAVTGRELKSGCRKYGRRFGNTSPSSRIPFHTSRAPDTRHVSRSAVLLRSTHSFVYGRLAADAAGWAISLADRWETVQKCAPSRRESNVPKRWALSGQGTPAVFRWAKNWRRSSCSPAATRRALATAIRTATTAARGLTGRAPFRVFSLRITNISANGSTATTRRFTMPSWGRWRSFSRTAWAWGTRKRRRARVSHHLRLTRHQPNGLLVDVCVPAGVGEFLRELHEAGGLVDGPFPVVGDVVGVELAEGGLLGFAHRADTDFHETLARLRFLVPQAH